jgi:FkbM family methyltransferase
MKVLYGIKENRVDVTDICLTKLTYNNTIITIPNGDDNRALFFNDHLYGILKKIFIILNDNEFEYDHTHIVKINIIDSTINTESRNSIIDDKLNTIHSKLKIKYGNLNAELPEQKMVVRYLTGNEKVLELGSNIGRNSLVIASIVKNDNFVTMECSINIAKQLEENRDINNYTFHIEKSALSKRKLIQRGWNTKPSNVLESGHEWVNTLSFDELQLKYNIEFDTLVLDCEGAFYFMLMDMPEILNNIKLVIMENDYFDIAHMEYVHSILKKYNFHNDYREAGGWGCCYNNFFEVWIR